MSELKRKIFDYRSDLPDTCEAGDSNSRQIDIFLDTISYLEQKIVQLEQKFVRVEHLAYHDELTGLPNRNLLRDRLNQAIKQAARHHNQLGLLFLDLNRFKNVNDTHGHETGDALLIQVAERLVSCTRAVDSAYRYGGDEFVILLPEVDGTKGSTELSRKLRARLAKPYSIGDLSLVVTASIGIAVYPTDGVTQHDLLRQADCAMYLAKPVRKPLDKKASNQEGTPPGTRPLK